MGLADIVGRGLAEPCRASWLG